MDEDNATPDVACTLTEEDKDERPAHVRSTLIETYDRATERNDGYTYYFEGTDESLVAAATFVSNELRCCSFADYTLEVSSPYEETQLTVTGPEGVKTVFGDDLIDRLKTL